MAVSPGALTFYADWRSKHVRAAFLSETDRPVPERVLQSLWHHQRLLREKLKTLDGKPVRVLHPGFWNHEAGPDFRGAVVQFGQEPAVSGDIEIDLRSEGWRAHGHDRNPNYAHVVLHVVWEPGGAVTAPAPTLALERFLDSPMDELFSWLGSDSAKGWPADLVGKCCAPLCELPEARLAELLRQAAQVRLQRKAEQIQARARHAGWEQTLWEGIFRALGYKQNIWAMQQLGELMADPEFAALGQPDSALSWQARWLGLGGLLPTQCDPKENGSYLRSIWDIWWRERDAARTLIHPKTLWHFNGLRPANLPQRRLALVSHWLANKDFIFALEKWFTTQTADTSPLDTLLGLLQVPDDRFWSWHWTFRSVRLPHPQPLIGAARVSDLAINVILPWFWMRAVAGKNEVLKQHAEQIYFKWPAAEDNSVLRLARHRLLGGLAPRKVKTAAMQQGLLQIVKDFCEHSSAICADCRFPDLVRSWNLQPGDEMG